MARPDRLLGVRIEWGQVESATGCTLDYVWYRPTVSKPGELVVLAHGFLRNKTRLAGLARALAESGISVVTVDFCNTRLWNGHHARNGFDLIAVADRLGARRLVYAGFSAGGLAALVAARNDPRTLGVLTLDLVDAQGLGRLMMRGFDRPVIGLFGEPASCNANNNGLLVLAEARQARIERIAGASHCDFEAPTDWLCRALCEPDHKGAEQRRAEILARSVSAILDLMSG
ncbi:MAG: alpha/beta hydrolase family protein [Thermochromatium sp.]